MKRTPRATRERERRLTPRQEQHHGRTLVFQFIFGILLTGGTAVMAWTLIKDPPALAGLLIVGFVLGLLGVLGLLCLYSGILSLFDRVGGGTTETVHFIQEKKIVLSRRRVRNYYLKIDRQAAHPTAADGSVGFWAFIRRYWIAGVDEEVYHQAVPGRFHTIVQGARGRVVYKVIPLSGKDQPKP